MISELNNPITLEDDLAINEALEAYDALTEEQKTYINGLPTLEAAAETILVLKADIHDVIALIAGLNTPITISQESAIQDARAAYDALTPYEQTLVTNTQRLVDAETDLATLYAEIEVVNNLILALNDPITIADEQAILEVREAFDALTTEQQTYVLQVSILTNAETELIVIQERIQHVIQLIIDVNHPVRMADEGAIQEARDAYDALTVLEKTYVTNVSDLLDAETDLATLYAEIAVVNEMITNLNDPINLNDDEALQEAREAYDALSEEQQGYVVNFPALEQAENDYQILLDEINAVIALIDALPDPVTLNDRAAVEAARAALNDLNPLQQERVTNQIKLIDAEAQLIDLTIVEEVTDQILALPTGDDVTIDDQAAIESARTSYEGLTTNQKSMMSSTTLDHLTNAESALETLLNPSQPNAFSLLPFHLASGMILGVLYVVKLKKKGA
jgi:hypothetical protein